MMESGIILLHRLETAENVILILYALSGNYLKGKNDIISHFHFPCSKSMISTYNTAKRSDPAHSSLRVS